MAKSAQKALVERARILRALRFRSGFAKMEIMQLLRRIIVTVLATALSMPLAGVPRHALAAAPNLAADVMHEHAADHQHHKSNDAQGMAHHRLANDAEPVSSSNQSCCVAWCVTIAIVADADPLVYPRPERDYASAIAHFRLAAHSAAIDPPPR